MIKTIMKKVILGTIKSIFYSGIILVIIIIILHIFNHYKLIAVSKILENYLSANYPNRKIKLERLDWARDGYIMMHYFAYYYLPEDKYDLRVGHKITLSRRISFLSAQNWLLSQNCMYSGGMQLDSFEGTSFASSGLMTPYNKIIPYPNCLHPRINICFINDNCCVNILTSIGGFKYNGNEIERVIGEVIAEGDLSTKEPTQEDIDKTCHYIISEYDEELRALYKETEDIAKGINKFLNDK